MENKFKNIKIEYHILQSVPVTCLNRDDVGSPKTAVIGGVKRARVSSQCWKRQVRVALHDAGVPIAVRTKRIADLILEHLDSGNNNYVEAAEIVASAISDDTLVFFSNSEAELLAKYIIEKEIKKDDKKLADKLHKSTRTIFRMMSRIRTKILNELEYERYCEKLGKTAFEMSKL